MTGTRDAGYDDWLDALESGDGYYLECANGHGSLPPRRVCPHCASRELTEETLPETGTVESHTTIHVATPSFVDDAPYVTAVADFGSVRLTGQMLVDGADGSDKVDVENGMEVAPRVGESETTGERLLRFESR